MFFYGNNMTTKKTGLMYSKAFAQYHAGDGYLVYPADTVLLMASDDYYDKPERVTQDYDMLEKTGLLKQLQAIEPRRATDAELLSAHSEAYIRKLDELSRGSGGIVGDLAQVGHGALDVIREAVGGDLNALDAVMQGKVQNAFCLQRPPGGHAERDCGFGFCIVNNFNIIVNRAREVYGLKRILIADFDNHCKKGHRRRLVRHQ